MKRKRGAEAFVFGTGQKITMGLCLLAIVGVLFARPSLFTEDPLGSHQKTSVLSGGGKGYFSDLKSPEENKRIDILAYEEPPFSFKDKQGRYTGGNVEILQAVLGRMGYTPRFVDMPFKRIQIEMRAGRYPAMVPCSINEERKEYLGFSKPVSSIYSVLWKSKYREFSWETYGDLKNHHIGASHYEYGGGFLEAAEKNGFFLDKVSHETPELIHFRKQVERKTDLFICELSTGLYIQKKYAPEFDSIDYCPKGVGPRRFHNFAFSKQYFRGRVKAGREFLNRFNIELDIFAREGGNRIIFEKYSMHIPMDEYNRPTLQETEAAEE